MLPVLDLWSSLSAFRGGGFKISGIDIGKARGSSTTVDPIVERCSSLPSNNKDTYSQAVLCLFSSLRRIPHLWSPFLHRHQSSTVSRS